MLRHRRARARRIPADVGKQLDLRGDRAGRDRGLLQCRSRQPNCGSTRRSARSLSVHRLRVAGSSVSPLTMSRRSWWRSIIHWCCPDSGTVPVDIVFGGQFYVQAKAADLGVELVPSAAKELARAGSVLRTVAQQKFSVAPLNPDIDHVALTMIHGPSPRHRAGAAATPSVLPNGTVDLDDPTTWTGTLDRSPCGTGTCARMAARHARGEQAIGQDFVHEGLLGTTSPDASPRKRRSAPIGPFALAQRPRLDHRLQHLRPRRG